MRTFYVALDRNDLAEDSEIRRLINDLKGAQQVPQRCITATHRIWEDWLIEQRGVAAHAQCPHRTQRVEEVLNVLLIVRLTLFKCPHPVFQQVVLVLPVKLLHNLCLVRVARLL